MEQNSYKTLGTLAAVNFFIMFALTYIGVYRLDDIYLNLNRFYMALLMVASMIPLMLFFMRSMFKNRKFNLVIYGVSALLFLGALLGIRTQTFVGNEQFLKSMIPHHSIAIKTCTYASISDPEIKRLCSQIIESQEEEIAEMEQILNDKY